VEALSAERECRSGGAFRVAEALRSRLDAQVLCGPRASVAGSILMLTKLDLTP
jgi:hypothetical protein